MSRGFSSALRRWGIVAFIPAAFGCEDFLSVHNPNVIDARALDPMSEASALAGSALQTWAWAYGWMAFYTAMFTGEVLSAETGFLPNEVAGRAINPATIDPYSGDILNPISRTIAAADEVLRPLMGVSGADAALNVARAALASGYSLIWMGEKYCEGVMNGGPPLTTDAVLDSAISRLTIAVEGASVAARGLTGLRATEANAIGNAALVGRARAHLQKGNLAGAATDAAQVPLGFRYDIRYADYASADRRWLGNILYVHSYVDRRGLSVAPYFRNLNDPRIPVLAPSEHKLPPMDGATEYWVQTKYARYDSPIRLASQLEAQYIGAEAQDLSAMLELIEARRSANGQEPYDGPVNAASVMIELMDQRSRDFFMEAKRLGDYRRHPDAVSNMPEPGTPYHKAGYGLIGDQTCWPVPDAERLNNENFR